MRERTIEFFFHVPIPVCLYCYKRYSKNKLKERERESEWIKETDIHRFNCKPKTYKQTEIRNLWKKKKKKQQFSISHCLIAKDFPANVFNSLCCACKERKKKQIKQNLLFVPLNKRRRKKERKNTYFYYRRTTSTSLFILFTYLINSTSILVLKCVYFLFHENVSNFNWMCVVVARLNRRFAKPKHWNNCGNDQSKKQVNEQEIRCVCVFSFYFILSIWKSG